MAGLAQMNPTGSGAERDRHLHDLQDAPSLGRVTVNHESVAPVWLPTAEHVPEEPHIKNNRPMHP